MTEVLVAIITGGMALVGVVITTLSSNRKIASQLQTAQAVADAKIEALTREVRLHNDFIQRVPVLEEQLRMANHRMESLEKHESQVLPM